MARRLSDKDDDEDDGTEENASDLSGSVYENESETDSSTNSSPSSVPATSDEPKTPQSDSAEDSTVGPRRSGRLKRASLTAAKMTLNRRNPTIGATETSDRTKVQSSHFSPLCWVLAACRRRLSKSIKQMAIDHFSKAIEALKISFKHAEHPFAFQPSLIRSVSFIKRLFKFAKMPYLRQLLCGIRTTTEHPDWVGWPTQVHIRAQYPNRLFVGYSRGHVALYDLSCVNPMYFSAADCHLAPVRLFHLINGPVRSMSLNCVNGRMLLVQGMNFHIQVWDIEDSVAQTADSPEMSYSVNHGLPGSEVLWHSRGDMWFFSRENTFQRRALLNSRGVPMRDYADLITQSDNLVGMTMFPAAPDSLRHLIPLGLQCVTRLDLSEPLNTLLCATDRGRLELVLCTLDGRSNLSIKERYLSQMRVPVCQWTMEQVEHTAESLDDVFRRLTASKCYILPASATFTPPALSNDFSDPSCGDCASERSFCWHKLWSGYKLTAQIEDQVPMKPSADYFKTPFLSISEARFCPNVESATWIAMGTACGFVQFYCADFLYLSEFSELLNEAEVSSSSSCLNSGKMPEIRSIPTPYIWRHSRAKLGAADTQNVARRRALRTAREGLPKGISRPHSRISLLSTSRRENVSPSDSDTTEAMTDITDERADTSSDTRKRNPKRREHRISNSEVRRMVFGRNNSPSIDELITLHRLRWLGHVLRMPVDRLPRRALFAQPCEGWKRARGGQTMTWQRSMKAITSKLSCAGHCRLPGWGPRDGPHQWLETLSDMAQSRPQWRSCIQAIAFNA
ncbi:hypothetical protein T265_08302 [Opisthorchis viverrini]|uniref:Uncharacterized protein n=1 Tax=Opisthorchis viverrini TaxID=6198 RepID=A0A074ZE61_OPIVI|nr:hypothetical protein T265_08302 [Opisthorchis viverrini]KER23942.1 hypothetical protein T265_08302 [Opisthorchis viverrini]